MWSTLIDDTLNDFRLSEGELAKKVNCDTSTMNNLHRGRTRKPRASFIRNLEDALNIKIDLEKLEYERNNFNSVPYPNIQENRYIVILQHSFIGVHVKEEIKAKAIDYIPIPYNKIDNCFAVKVETEDMSSYIIPGDILLVDLDADYSDNNIVIVTLNTGENFIGYYSHSKGINIVYFNNKKRKPIVFSNQEIKAIGRIKKIVREI